MNWRLFFDRLRGIQPSATPVSQPPVKEITMTLADAKTYLQTHLALAEADIKGKYEEVIAWIETKLANDAVILAAEIAHLQSLGYVVTPPAPPVA